MPKLPVWVLLAVVPAFSAVAQTTEPGDAALRSKALGEIRTTDGKPWVGAKVTLVSYPVPGIPAAGEVDRLEAETDARGRFRAPVLRNRRYSVWAISGRRVSKVAEGVVAGKPVLLAEAQVAAEQNYEIQGLEAWKDYGPMRVFVVPELTNRHTIAATLDDKHHFPLPALPGKSCTLEVRDKDGLVRHRQTLTVPTENSPDPIAIVMDPPKLVYLAVRDIQTEKGLAGASILLAHQGALVPIGKTDADGVARLAVPRASGSNYSAVFAAAPGYSMSPFQNGDANQVKNKKWKPLRDVAIKWHTNLNRGLRFKGRIMLDKAHPAANLTLLLRGQGMHFQQTNSRSVGVYRRIVRTDQNGHFELDNCLPEEHWRTEIFAVLSPRHVAALPESWQRELQPRLDDLYPLSKGDSDKPNDLGVLNLRSLCPVRFTILDASGQPAPFAKLSVSRGGSPNTELFPVGQVHADRNGRALVLLRPGDETVVAVRSKGAVALHRVDVQSAEADSSIADVALKLGGGYTISGRVVDGKGKPVAGVSIRTMPRYNRGVVNLPGEDAEEGRHKPGKNSALLAAIGDATSATHILQSLLGRRLQSTTDAKGAFRIEVPAIPMQYQLYLSHQRRSLRQTVTIEDGSVSDLEFELR